MKGSQFFYKKNRTSLLIFYYLKFKYFWENLAQELLIKHNNKKQIYSRFVKKYFLNENQMQDFFYFKK